MERKTREDRLHLGFAVLLTATAALGFYLPALQKTGGDWPAPLDDVFIHFDFARAAAQGHPFEWIAGQGFSSGETSPLYAFVLAAGYLVGFRGLWLGAWAAIVACASLVVLMRSLRELARPAPWWVSGLGASMVVAIGILDWTWFSGMEVALFAALLGRALCAARRARDASPTTRSRAQWICGGWGALLVVTRPEAAVLVAVFAVIVARRAGARSAILALARVGLGGALATLGVFAANRALTGDAMSAGARLKLLSENPYYSDIDRAREALLNLLHAKWKILDALSVHSPFWPILPALAFAGLFSRRTRALTVACLAGAIGWTLLVSWNSAARYQNFRYYMPALVLVLVATTLGLAALARRRSLGRIGFGLGLAGVLLAIPSIPRQITFFRDAAANIHDQQVETGRRLAVLMPSGARVLVGDAGAIPYVSGHHAIDALGLGGYRGMPVARAATHGEAATVELLQRLAPSERPAYLALYPNWFSGITQTFGREIDRVVIANNVICGGSVKGIYLADWRALDGDDEPELGTVDALDVADVISETQHAYVSPAPNGGWTRLEVQRGHGKDAVFDGGRVIPEGQRERFVLLHGTSAPATLSMRTDRPRGEVELEVLRGDVVVERALLSLEAAVFGEWATLRATLRQGVERGDVITLMAKRGEYRNFHVWVASEARSRF